MNLPHSDACDRNQGPILELISGIFTKGTILEIGSGTGQHAEFFSKNLNVQWQPSDVQENLATIQARKKSHDCHYLNPFQLMVCDIPLSKQIPWKFDGAFTANTCHIMNHEEFTTFAMEIGELLKPGSPLVIYGPFIFEGHDLAESNKRFDESLKSRDPGMGIRHFEELKENLSGFKLVKVHPMPANNHLLHFKKI